VGKSFAVFVSVLAALSCLRAQEQERKLVDRLLRPDMSLQNSEQKKKFIADGTPINKKASVGTFYVEKKSNSKTFSGTREFSAQQFHSRPFHGNRSAFENSSQQPVGNSRLTYPTQTARGPRDAPQSDKRSPATHTQRTDLFWIKVKAKSRSSGKTRRSRSSRCASC
jgi:hypothetical protein